MLGDKCLPIDNCLQSPCDPQAQCITTGPGTHVCQCNTGYSASPDGKRCVPINMCLANPSPCDANAKCVMTGPGLFQCTCKK
jgi:hypothetical protein